MARASPPPAFCSHQPPSPPSSRKPTCTAAQRTAVAQDSIQETVPGPRGESAAICEAHPQEEEEEETDRPACRSSRYAAAVPYGQRSPGRTRSIGMQGAALITTTSNGNVSLVYSQCPTHSLLSGLLLGIRRMREIEREYWKDLERVLFCFWFVLWEQGYHAS